MPKSKTHVMHVIHRFDTGGLENGVVNLINHLEPDCYQHSIVTLKGHNPEFAKRILTNNVRFFDLDKKDGNDLRIFGRLNKLIKQHKPDVLHTRNTSALEMQLVGWWRSVPLRIHGEHGWDVNDLKGQNRKYRILKWVMKRFIHQYITLSKEAGNYIVDIIKVKERKVNRICNGVDTEKFTISTNEESALPQGFKQPGELIFGTVGRLAKVKNQSFLLEAFINLLSKSPEHKHRLKLVIVGDGILKDAMLARCQQAGIADKVYFAGNRNDVSTLMKSLDIFILPSLAEGISNTFLEAMATGLPVIATNVGGNPDLILPEHAQTHLVPVNDVNALVKAMGQYLHDDKKLKNDALKVRQHCVNNFGIKVMVSKYHHLYQSNNQ